MRDRAGDRTGENGGGEREHGPAQVGRHRPILRRERCRGKRAAVALLGVAWIGVAAAHGEDRELDPAAIAARIPSRVLERTGWARDLAAAFDLLGRRADPAAVCTALAVVEQGSDFEVDRRLRHRAHYDFRELLRRRFGSVGATLVEALLRSSGGGPSGDFLERFENARTEGDVDRAYRDLVLVWEVRAPLFVTAADVAGRALFGAGAAELDPIRTLGPMQVSVAWAAARTDTNPADPELRAILASRRGGLVVGVARLFATSRKYADPAFLVADYNAGLFASRNAAFQEELSEIEGVPLPLDGDLLSYRPDGTARAASQTLAALERFAREERLAAIGVGARADLELEKSAAFESTASWHAVRAEWSRRRGAEAPYARLPAVRFESLHDSRPTTVGAYVRHVMEKYRRCLALTPGGRDSAR